MNNVGNIFQSSQLDFIRFIIEDDFCGYHEFESNLEQGLLQAQDAFHNRVKADLKGMPEEQHAEYTDFVNSHYLDLQDLHPQLARRALYLLIYGAAELHLKAICDSAYYDGKSARKTSEANWYIDKSKKHLTKYINGIMPPFSNEWSTLDSMRIIRNAIAHDSGYLRKKGCKRNVQSFVNNNRSFDLSITDNSRILLGPKCINSLILFLEDFLFEIIRELKNI